jgi:glycosyltransferase involved in cell wall biosynthesis
MKKKPFVVISTTRYAVDRFMLEALDAISNEFDIISINGESEEPFLLPSGNEIKCIKVSLKRQIYILSDMIGLAQLIYHLLKIRPLIVQTFTPKGGLLGIVAARLVFVPKRVHFYTGQVWATHTGLKRMIFILLDKLVCKLSTITLTDSHSQLKYLVDNKVASNNECEVLGMGSLGGVDIVKFQADPLYYSNERAKLGLKKNQFVILYMARMTVDKGAIGLINSFVEYKLKGGTGILICVGPDEENLCAKMKLLLGSYLNEVIFVGFTETPEHYFKISDVYFMPSLREGFGSVYLLAASCSLPSVGSNIYGTVDAITHGFTGYCFEPDDYNGFANCLVSLEKDIYTRMLLGNLARERVVDFFSSTKFSMNYSDFVHSRLKSFE